MTDRDKLVLGCQDASLALLRKLFLSAFYDEGSPVAFSTIEALAEHTELRDDPRGVNLDRVLRQGAPDEIDLEAFIRVAYALGYNVVLEERE